MLARFLALALVAAAARAADTLLVDASRAPPASSVLPDDYVGLSYEVKCAPQMLSLNGAPRATFVSLMQQLAAGSPAGVNLRIGGNSADESAYAPGNDPLPDGAIYRIGPADFAAYKYAALFNGSVTLGMNFRGGDDASAEIAHATALAAAIPWASGLVEALEIGNEVDLYVEKAHRPSTWTGADWAAQTTRIIAALAGAGVPPNRIQGATFCCDKLNFDAALPAFYAANAATGLRSVSYHQYPLNVCTKPPVTHTIAELLANDASDKDVPAMAARAADARKAGLPFVIGEGNSIACGGQAGVSDVFASALWAVDVLATHAFFSSGWRFHGCPSGPYTAIAYDDVTQDVPDVRPMFYGLYAFAQFARGVAPVNATVTTSNALVRAHAFTSPSGAWRVAVVHKDPAAQGAARVTVRLPAGAGAGGNAMLSRLTAPSASATSGVAYRGRTWDGSTTGAPSGTPVDEVVKPSADGTYAFDVEPASAAFFFLG